MVKKRKKIGLSVKNFSLQEHDDLMKKQFQNCSDKLWNVNNNVYCVYLKSLNDSPCYLWGYQIDKINTNKISKNFPTAPLIFKGRFLKILFDRLLENPNHRLFLYFFDNALIKDIDKEILIDAQLVQINDINKLLSLNKNYIPIDSRLFSFFKLNRKVINNKTELNIYFEDSFIYYLITSPKRKGEKRIYGLKTKNLL